MTSIRLFTFAVFGLLLTLPGITSADLSDGLVAHWPFEGNADDASGNGHHGEVYEATLTTDRFGRPDNAYFLDGVNGDRVTIQNDPTLSPAQLSLTAWIRPIESSLSANVIVENMQFNPACCYGYTIFVRYPSKRLGFQLATSPSVGSFIEIDFDYAPDTWYFVAATYDGQDIRLYVDGVLLGTLENTLGYGASTYGWVAIGTNSNASPAQHFAGSIDDVRLYSRALSPEEVQQLFTRAESAIADIDGNGEAGALTDGLLFLRYLFGFTGDTLIAGAVGENCTRCTATEIENYLATLMP